jgi:hypothetical protein
MVSFVDVAVACRLFRSQAFERTGVAMKKHATRLSLAKESIRQLVPDDLGRIGGAGISCGANSACDCSSSATTGNNGSLYCTKIQY